MKAIGMVEYKTVSSGIKAADLIVKTAEVELLEAQTVCPGKFIILFTGDLSAIRVSVDAAVKTYPESLIDSFVLGNPHESLYRALHCTAEVDTDPGPRRNRNLHRSVCHRGSRSCSQDRRGNGI